MVVSESCNHDHTLASPEAVPECCGVLHDALIGGSGSESGEGVQSVAQIPDRRFVGQSLRRVGRSLLSLGVTGVVALALLAASSAQGQGGASKPSRKDQPPISPVNPTPQQVVPRPVAPLPSPASVEETTLPVPPSVKWDGKLLTVDAENSALSDVLIAIRDRTGAMLELSGDPARERVFVHLGPGSAREIISDLLYGTQFDYIVLASDDDPDALRSVVVTPRGRGDISIDAVVAGAADTNTGTGEEGSTLAAGSARDGGGGHERAARMMPGYSGPSKPTFQVEAEAALVAQKAAQEPASAADTGEASANAQNSGADSAGSQEAKSDHPSSSPAASSPAASITESDLPPPTERASSSASASDSNDQSGVAPMIQNMTRMFEQRRQIQAQQNQPPQQPSSN